MSVDVTAKLQSLKSAVETAKAEKNRAEARMEELTKQRDQEIANLAALGVVPENLDSELTRLETERDRLIAEAEELLKGAA